MATTTTTTTTEDLNTPTEMSPANTEQPTAVVSIEGAASSVGRTLTAKPTSQDKETSSSDDNSNSSDSSMSSSSSDSSESENSEDSSSESENEMNGEEETRTAGVEDKPGAVLGATAKNETRVFPTPKKADQEFKPSRLLLGKRRQTDIRLREIRRESGRLESISAFEKAEFERLQAEFELLGFTVQHEEITCHRLFNEADPTEIRGGFLTMLSNCAKRQHENVTRAVNLPSYYGLPSLAVKQNGDKWSNRLLLLTGERDVLTLREQYQMNGGVCRALSLFFVTVILPADKFELLWEAADEPQWGRTDLPMIPKSMKQNISIWYHLMEESRRAKEPLPLDMFALVEATLAHYVTEQNNPAKRSIGQVYKLTDSLRKAHELTTKAAPFFVISLANKLTSAVLIGAYDRGLRIHTHDHCLHRIVVGSWKVSDEIASDLVQEYVNDGGTWKSSEMSRRIREALPLSRGQSNLKASALPNDIVDSSGEQTDIELSVGDGSRDVSSDNDDEACSPPPCKKVHLQRQKPFVKAAVGFKKTTIPAPSRQLAYWRRKKQAETFICLAPATVTSQKISARLLDTFPYLGPTAWVVLKESLLATDLEQVRKVCMMTSSRLFVVMDLLDDHQDSYSQLGPASMLLLTVGPKKLPQLVCELETVSAPKKKTRVITRDGSFETQAARLHALGEFDYLLEIF